MDKCYCDSWVEQKNSIKEVLITSSAIETKPTKYTQLRDQNKH